MRYPEYLSEQGTIGFVAPSFGCNIEPYRTAFDNAQKKFRAMGHPLMLGPNCYEGRGIGISNTPEACGAELTDCYCSDESEILISCGGGELMCETISRTDWVRIKAAKPKWYMGFSDNTNMTFLLATLCDTASIYGPCAAAFGMEPWHQSLTDAYELLRGLRDCVHGYPLWEKEGKKDEEHPLEPYHVTEERKLRVFLPSGLTAMSARDGSEVVMQDTAEATGVSVMAARDGSEAAEPGTTEQAGLTAMSAQGRSEAAAGGSGGLTEAPSASVRMEGRLIGGCMDCLINLTGTVYDKTEEFAERYREDGIIWFLESCDLNVMAIRRAVWQMKHAGWFSCVKGFLIGRPLVFGQELMGLDQYHAVCDLLGEYHVPVIMDVDLGHLPPMMPLICGSYAAVTVEGNELEIRMERR